jgi:hypothetical protein
MSNLKFVCPDHGETTGKPIGKGKHDALAVLKLGCGCQFIAIAGIGFLKEKS